MVVMCIRRESGDAKSRTVPYCDLLEPALCLIDNTRCLDDPQASFQSKQRHPGRARDELDSHEPPDSSNNTSRIPTSVRPSQRRVKTVLNEEVLLFILSGFVSTRKEKEE